MKQSKNCLVCNKIFELRRGKKGELGKFCSLICKNKSQVGVKLLSRTMEKHPYWKGGKSVHNEGYILIYSPKHSLKKRNGYMLEHRLVMEKHIGRYLTKDEIIHHINEKVDDNRIENLQLLTKGEHSSLHRKKNPTLPLLRNS